MASTRQNRRSWSAAQSDAIEARWLLPYYNTDQGPRKDYPTAVDKEY